MSYNNKQTTLQKSYSSWFKTSTAIYFGGLIVAIILALTGQLLSLEIFSLKLFGNGLTVNSVVSLAILACICFSIGAVAEISGKKIGCLASFSTMLSGFLCCVLAALILIMPLISKGLVSPDSSLSNQSGIPMSFVESVTCPSNPPPSITRVDVIVKGINDAGYSGVHRFSYPLTSGSIPANSLLMMSFDKNGHYLSEYPVDVLCANGDYGVFRTKSEIKNPPNDGAFFPIAYSGYERIKEYVPNGSSLTAFDTGKANEDQVLAGEGTVLQLDSPAKTGYSQCGVFLIHIAKGKSLKFSIQNGYARLYRKTTPEDDAALLKGITISLTSNDSYVFCRHPADPNELQFLFDVK